MVNDNRHSQDGQNPVKRGDIMKVYEMYGYIAFVPKRPNCSEKELYSSQGEAVRAADEHNRRVVFADMNAYECDRHQAWHIGHRNKHRAAHEALMASIMWFKAWEAELKQ